MNISPLIISFKVACTATILTIILGIPFAWKVANMKKGKGLIDGIATMPMVLPPTIVGFFLLLLIGKNSPFGKFLLQFDITLTFTWIAAVLASVVVSFPLMYRTARGAFEAVDTNLIYAGQTLGMSNFTIFRKVVLPNTMSSILAGVVLTFARALGEFGATIMVAGNIPGRTQTMSVAIYSAVQGGQREQSYAWVAVIMLISFGSIISMNWFSNREKGNSKGVV
ncbi:MAG: molybdate ABC transporter permease subunit [Candidatus Galacturonibacter soehngenii]|nr:molybdate ABC transporter permease subunit [Candidatus Galacturonibacter soehngenii]